jgi:hypothetical protein
MNIETGTMKRWAESVSKAHDLLVWGHHLRVKEILQEARDNIRIAVEEADATPPAAAQRKPLPKGEWPKHPSVDDPYIGYEKSDLDNYAIQVLAAHGIKE